MQLGNVGRDCAEVTFEGDESIEQVVELLLLGWQFPCCVSGCVRCAEGDTAEQFLQRLRSVAERGNAAECSGQQPEGGADALLQTGDEGSLRLVRFTAFRGGEPLTQLLPVLSALDDSGPLGVMVHRAGIAHELAVGVALPEESGEEWRRERGCGREAGEAGADRAEQLEHCDHRRCC
ncbi:MAG: hypothetical protein ABIK37_05165 [candidate division WOR-3 bacterium]